MTGNRGIVGRVVEIGDLAALGGQPGILIACDREALRDCPDNLFAARVRVTRAGDGDTAEKKGAGREG